MVGRVGEGFLRDLRIRVFDHLQKLSMPYYDREKAGVIVSRMTSDIDSLQELVQMGLLQFLSSALLIVLSVDRADRWCRWQLLLDLPHPDPVRGAGQHQVPARLEPGLPLGARPHRHDAVLAAGGHLRGAGHPGVQPRGRRDRPLRRGNRTLYDAHMRSVWIQAWYLPVIEFAGLGTTALVIGLGGWMVTEDIVTVGTIAFFVLVAVQPVRAGAAALAALQPGAVGRRRPEQAVRAARHAGRRRRAARRRRGPPRRPARSAVEDVTFAYAGGEPGAARRRPGDQRRASGSRWWARPAPASRRWPSSSPASTTPPTGRVTFGGVDLRDGSLASLRRTA